MQSRTAIGSLLALSALAGCGGEDLGRPPPPGPAVGTDVNGTDWCEVAVDYEFLNIMDFEPGGTTTGLCDTTSMMSSESCNSYSGADGTHACGMETTFRPAGNVFGGDAIPGDLCDEPANGLHVVGTSVAACIPPDHPEIDIDSDGKIGWGAAFELQDLPHGAPPSGGGCIEPEEGIDPPGSIFFDATCWDGISLWARKSGPQGGTSITITVSDVWTSPGKKDPETGEDFCSTSATVLDTAKCDAPGVAVSLTEEWTFITLPFAVLKQKGYGVPSPIIAIDPGNLQIDPGNIRGMKVLMSPGDWDIWFDDIAFYRARN